jgi:hypothetical protein
VFTNTDFQNSQSYSSFYCAVYKTILLPIKSLPIPRPAGSPPNDGGGVVVLVDVLGALPGGCVGVVDGVG